MSKNLIKFTTFLFVISIAISCGDSSDRSTAGSSDEEGFRVFITSDSYTGDLGGLTGADEICQQHAEDAGLDETYIAILSDSTEDANDRITASEAIYIYTSENSKTKIVDNDIDLWDTSENDLQAKINYDENYNRVTVEPWTGSLLTGGVDTNRHCSDWSSDSSSDDGAYGDSSAKDNEWLSNSWEECDSSHPIICISQ